MKTRTKIVFSDCFVKSTGTWTELARPKSAAIEQTTHPHSPFTAPSTVSNRALPRLPKSSVFFEWTTLTRPFTRTMTSVIHGTPRVSECLNPFPISYQGVRRYLLGSPGTANSTSKRMHKGRILLKSLEENQLLLLNLAQIQGLVQASVVRMTAIAASMFLQYSPAVFIVVHQF